MRIATFNLESFGEDPFDADALMPRIARLRPVLDRLDADILCLQEVNAQHRKGKDRREFDALATLLHDTRYEAFHRTTSGGDDPAERHNLAVLSRFPIIACRDILNDYVDAPRWMRRHAEPPDKAAPAVTFDRPILSVTVSLPEGRPLHLFCVHLRAPLAAPVPGQKLSANVWKSVPGWAEGYFAAAMKRTGQALELREAVDGVFDTEPDALVAAMGDFNAVDVEPALRIILADPDDTGNPELAGRRLFPVEAAIAEDRRFTVSHHGHHHMLDHILVSTALSARLKSVQILNRDLADEVDDSKTQAALGSFHAPLVADFAEQTGQR
ncbi:endonuclease/exonuclease/phosphatase family metal-dependent hydrolase [Breoghania corrubedonensis]|uniref:Endonuclease/exonuclease/phosphatase family metal-dependent hydrolase n=1 Tax=Breoghania corrubedonensis TaxID=665038 RepID=A0A2T5VHU6_9HYPH|nr:endonuclease/exonuclease/phosphatase family protein [Breoghania corrubedonensis]PTW63337.1 endonuclease/exonuclease/phosphatase family metal-dependent hydrolase [Breoghania corrubedonensis]